MTEDRSELKARAIGVTVDEYGTLQRKRRDVQAAVLRLQELLCEYDGTLHSYILSRLQDERSMRDDVTRARRLGRNVNTYDFGPPLQEPVRA